MGMRKLNEAICDKCGRTERSVLKQSEFIKVLHNKGWKGNVNDLLCPLCSVEAVYRLTGVKRVNGTYYVTAIAVNAVYELGSICIPYSEIAPINGNTIPTITSNRFIRECADKKLDPNSIPQGRLEVSQEALEIDSITVNVAHLK